MTTLHDIALLRLVAQRIAAPPLPTAADAVRWLTAAQAQDLSGVLTSIALRTDGGTRAGIEAALNAGEVVRSWPMRGTLHLVAAEDLPWILRLCAARVVAGSAGRRAQLDLDTPTLQRAGKLAVEALTGGHRLSREDLFAAWEAGGLATGGQRGYHMLGYLAQTGIVCFGPMRGSEQLVVLVDEWIGYPRALEREEAAGELAWRYFRSHGPATVKDFTRWANLVAPDVRAGLALARPRLARVDADGVEYLLDPQTADLLRTCRRRAQGVFLLPGFDEYILGYTDRRAVVPAAFADRIVPGGNGMFRPTVISDGQVVGTWKQAGRGTKRAVDATPFVAFSNEVAEAIPRVYASPPYAR